MSALLTKATYAVAVQYVAMRHEQTHANAMNEVHGRTHVRDQQRRKAIEAQMLATPDPQVLRTPT